MSEPAPAATVRALTQRRRRLLPRAAGALLLVLAALTAALASPAAVRADPASPTPAPTAGPTATPLPTASSTTTPTVTPLPAASPHYSGGGGIITSLIFGPAIDAVAGLDHWERRLGGRRRHRHLRRRPGQSRPHRSLVPLRLLRHWSRRRAYRPARRGGDRRLADAAGGPRVGDVRRDPRRHRRHGAPGVRAAPGRDLHHLHRDLAGDPAPGSDQPGHRMGGGWQRAGGIAGGVVEHPRVKPRERLPDRAGLPGPDRRDRGLLPRVAGPGRRHLRGGGLHPPDRPDLTVARRAQRPEADRRDALRALHQQVRDGLRSGPGGERAHPIHHPQRKPGLRARRDTDLPACGAGALRSLPPSPPARGDRGRRHGRPCLGHRQAGRQRRRPHRCSGRRRRRIRRHLGGGRRRCRHEQRGLIRLPHPRLWARRDGGTGRAEDCRRRGPARWWTAGQWPRGRRRLPRGAPAEGGQSPSADTGPTPAALDTSAPSGSTNQPATGQGPSIASTQPRRITPQQEGSPA